MKQPTRPLKVAGFTIIELMIATSVFSVVLLLCTFSFLRIGQVFYKGVAMSSTQDNARVVLDEVSNVIRLGGHQVEGPTAIGSFQSYCMGGNRYIFNPNSPMRNVASDRSLWVRPGCTNTSPSAIGSDRELIDRRMRIERFEIWPVPDTEGLFRVTVRIIQGEDDLIGDVDGSNDGFAECLGGAGSHFCAVSELETTVQRRN